ncbi:DUF58 domain-containing protein [Frondihabitans cladoniiphilus]|uniref:DUF58 domain-containing protein n=1 Tax=Frondihabitans cladoniiphilus TaxID=715785 RepID=A0ABP8VLN7_9MICO
MSPTRTSGTGLTATSSRRSGLSRSGAYRHARRALRRWETVVGGAARTATGVVTPLGWAVLAGSVLALGLGYGLGWTEFAVAGVGTGILAAVSALFLIGRTRFTVALTVETRRTVVGSPVEGSVELGADSRRPLWGARLEVRIGAELVPLRLPGVGESGRSSTAFEVPARQRGIVTVGPVRTVRGDPLGLFRRDVEWTETVEVFVHPATVVVPSTSTGFIRDLEGSPTRDLTASDISFHALREYRPGDDRRHIHWKSTARTGQLTVRQFEETRRSHLVVAFGLADADYADPDEFELAVGAASSIALRAIRDGRDLSVLTSPATPAFAAPDDEVRAPRVVASSSRQRLLDDVSSLASGTSTVGLSALARLATEQVSGISLVFLVCGSTPSLRELQSWSLRFPLGVQIVVVVCRPTAEPSLRRIGELSIVTIGYLDDLRAALHRGAQE